MAKTNVQKLTDKIHKQLKDLTTDKQTLEEIAKFSVDRIQRTTRSGKTPDGKSFAGLADSTKYQRGHLEQFNTTHDNYRKNRSNNTFTGELLDSLKYAISGNKITFSFVGIHKKYKTGSKRKGKKSGKRISNAELADVLEKGNSSRNLPPRPFVGINEAGIERIKRIVSKAIRAVIKK